MPNSELRVSVIFLDDVGVISDPALRAIEWPKLVGEFFTPLLGGRPEQWSEANSVVFRRFEPDLLVGPKGTDYLTWFRARHIAWMRGMAEYVGVSAPVEDEACALLARKATEYVSERARSEYQDVRGALARLRSLGFTLHTSSGQNSWELECILKAAGVRQCFNTLFGADLVNCWKYSEEYYRRILKSSGADPDSSLVVDDQPRCLQWAASLGAKTCLMKRNPGPDGAADLVVESLGQLAEVLAAHRHPAG